MVHSSLFDIADPLAHGGILLDLPFDPGFQAPLSDDDLGLLSAPTSPESLLDEPLASLAVPHKADTLRWDSILGSMPEEPASKLRGAGVMWNVPAFGAGGGPPPLRAVFGAPSPVSSDPDLDFHSFIAEECLSSDDEVLIADGGAARAAAGHKRRRTAGDAAAAAAATVDAAAAAQQQQQELLQAKRVKLAALHQLPPHVSADTPEGKRHMHNVLERKRREDLKVSYQNLRLQVPELAGVERAPTGQILVRAAECIAGLKDEDERIMAQLRALRVQNASLRARAAVAQA